MGPLIDSELERVDRKHAQLTQLSSDLVEALSLYHTLMREPQNQTLNKIPPHPYNMIQPPSMVRSLILVLGRNYGFVAELQREFSSHAFDDGSSDGSRKNLRPDARSTTFFYAKPRITSAARSYSASPFDAASQFTSKHSNS